LTGSAISVGFACSLDDRADLDELGLDGEPPRRLLTSSARVAAEVVRAIFLITPSF
jgi:hypothetical protein